MDNWAKIIIGDSRAMLEVADAAVDLVVTSPPYWHIKDYGTPGQHIGRPVAAAIRRAKPAL